MGGSECGAFKRKHSHALLIALSAPHVFQSGNPTSSILIRTTTYHFKSTTTVHTLPSQSHISLHVPRSNKRGCKYIIVFLQYMRIQCLDMQQYVCMPAIVTLTYLLHAHFLFALHPVNIFKTWLQKMLTCKSWCVSALNLKQLRYLFF